MIFNEKYYPLFDFKQRSKIRYIVVVGGRASGKSTAIAHLLHDFSFLPDNVVLSTRFTMSSARDSVVAEMEKAINDRKSNDFFKPEYNTLINTYSNSKIIFKGLQTARLNQTAALKSITDLNVWILDEAEELKDVDMFDDVDETIRRKDHENIIILILNSYRINKNHFIYERFFLDRNVNWGFNGIKDDVMYIFTTYLDNYQNLSKSAKEKIKYFKEHYPERYKYRYLGELRDKAEGVIFSNWKYGKFEAGISGIRVFGLDFGIDDPDTLIQVAINKRLKKLFVKEWIYKSGNSINDLIKIFKQLKITSNDVIIADSSGAKIIKDLKQAGYYVRPCEKGANSVIQGIKKMLDYEIIVEGENIAKELNNYVWADKKIEVPEDSNNHAIDAIRYGMQFAEKI